METRKLGAAGPLVGSVGLGCAGMSWAYSESTRDDDVSSAVIQSALDHGVTFFDTADVYGGGHNEELVGRALRRHRHEVTVATKVGLVAQRSADPSVHTLRRDGSPKHLLASVDASLYRLGDDTIDLYYLHRVDPLVPLAETWGALAELVAKGKVRWLGLSEVTAAQAQEAHAIHPVTAIQSEFSLWTRDPLEPAPTPPDGSATRPNGATDVVGWCRENGAAFVPFAPLGRGFLTGAITAATVFDRTDFRNSNPRFANDAVAANQRILHLIRLVAARYRATPAQIAIAWVLAQGDHVIPVPGTKHRRYLQENVGAARIPLSEEDLQDLAAAPTPVGSRY